MTEVIQHCREKYGWRETRSDSWDETSAIYHLPGKGGKTLCGHKPRYGHDHGWFKMEVNRPRNYINCQRCLKLSNLKPNSQ